MPARVEAEPRASPATTARAKRARSFMASLAEARSRTGEPGVGILRGTRRALTKVIVYRRLSEGQRCAASARGGGAGAGSTGQRVALGLVREDARAGEPGVAEGQYADEEDPRARAQEQAADGAQAEAELGGVERDAVGADRRVEPGHERRR